jgi:hypothetical protein
VASALWLAAAPDAGTAVTRVLEAARRELSHFRRLTVEYPADEFRQEIEAAGFAAFRTLLWMRATTSGSKRINERRRQKNDEIHPAVADQRERCTCHPLRAGITFGGGWLGLSGWH